MLRVAVLGAIALFGFGSAHAQEPIRIGLLDDMSSAYSGLGGEGTALAIRMAIDDFGGKIGDRQIEFRSADHLNKPDNALSLASAWLKQDKFDVLLGGGNSAALLAVQNMMKSMPDRTLIVSGSSNLDFSGKACTANSMHFAPNNYVLLAPTVKALTDRGDKDWYILSSDNAGGKTATSVATKKLGESGAKLVGNAYFPLEATEFSSYLLQVQGSGAKVLGLATSGSPLVAIVKQAHEFQLTASGMKMVLLAAYISDIHALGLETAQNLVFSTIFYWDRNDKTRGWAKRFLDKHHAIPTEMQAAAYAATTHYLQAVKAEATTDARKVVPQMKKAPINSILFDDAYVREDGAAIWGTYLVEVKTPAESKAPWDYYKILAEVSGKDANLTQEQQGCPGFSQ